VFINTLLKQMHLKYKYQFVLVRVFFPIPAIFKVNEMNATNLSFNAWWEFLHGSKQTQK